MKIEITTKRLPNKYPEGSVYEVEELNGALAALVEQGEAVIVGQEPKEETIEEVIEEVVEEKEVKAELKKELKEKGVSVKGNPSVETLEKKLKETE